MAQQFLKTDLVTTSDHEQQQQQQQQSNTTAAMDQTTTTLTTLYLWQNTKVLSIIICCKYYFLSFSLSEMVPIPKKKYSWRSQSIWDGLNVRMTDFVYEMIEFLVLRARTDNYDHLSPLLW